MKYDGLGRRTEINNPDAGRTRFTYDSAGNLTRKITAELDAKGKAIRYHYDHNRLVQIDYPFMDDVYYTYGSSGSGYNRAGRIYRTDNGTVSEELYFGRLGETIKSVKSIKDGNVSTSYTTKYTFDNLGRMRTLTYPDGEILTYNYGKGGLLKSAIGETTKGRTVYLENMQYDAFGQRTYVKYGNGAESTYTYESVMRRLENLKTTSTDGKVLQNITYKYDKVGNITNRNNNGFNTNDDVTRNSEQSYEYDKMDRLTGSTGKFNYETWNPFWDKRVNTYTSEMTYSNTGKILTKTQENRGLFEDTGQTVEIPETTYDWAYEYTGAHPNAVTKAGTRSMSYDLNGNMTQMTDSSNTLTRSLLWDEENRLKKITDSSGSNSVVTSCEYDANGMRALKKGKYGTVQYVSENYVVRNKDLISKHVFAGNTRLVSNMVMREEKSGKMVATEQGSYYYHADHLGSSSVVTDKQGKFYEQIEYFPYGETWINNKATAEQASSPYKFTGKEYDPETGWYYFWARYYDAKLSRWISADPAMSTGEYFPTSNKRKNANLPGMGGVFNSANLDAYQYAHDNPTKYTDPDGRVTFDQKTKKLVAEPGGSIPVNNRETRVKQKGDGMLPDGETACRYRGLQGGVEEFVGKNMTVGQINDATSSLTSDADPAMKPGGKYSVNRPIDVIKDALQRLGDDPSNYNIFILKPGDEGYENASGKATYTLRGMESKEVKGKIGHWQVGDGAGNFIWDPWNGPTHNKNRKMLEIQYIFIRPKEE